VTDFLVLRKNGPGEADVEGCAVVRNKKADEGEQAIREGMTRGEGTYMAVTLSNVIVREAQPSYKLVEPDDEKD
jgi:hypothetical protein